MLDMVILRSGVVARYTRSGEKLQLLSVSDKSIGTKWGENGKEG